MRNVLFSVMVVSTVLFAQGTTKPPVTWDDVSLREWATPIAGLNVRPGHFSTEEYHSAPIDNLRTYPVYHPGREPAGYWDMLQSVGPKPLIEPETLKSDADWIRAGQRVFDEYDIAAFRVHDPKVVALARSPEGFAGPKSRRALMAASRIYGGSPRPTELHLACPTAPPATRG